MGLFDDSFDIEKYIESRMMDIESLQDRQLYKEIIAGVMAGIYANASVSYKELEKRIFDEVPHAARMPDVITGIVRRGGYDMTDRAMFPMDIRDLEPISVNVPDMLAAREQGKPFYLYTCLLEEDARSLRYLIDNRRVFRGIIENEYSETSASFVIRPAARYIERLEQLHAMSRLNAVPWRSVLAPYLYKLVDVYVTDIEEWDDQLEVREIRVDFEEFADKVRYDVIPIWNVKPVTIKANAYPQPAIERGFYEHYLYASQFDQGASYLVRDTSATLRSLTWRDGDLYILCDKDEPLDWKFCEFRQDVEKRDYGWPLFSNQQDDSFSTNMREAYGERIKTRTDLIRFLRSFMAGRELEFIDARVMDRGSQKDGDTYETEKFIFHEFRTGRSAGAFRLDFRAKNPASYTNRDIMSFLVAGVQHFFPEYDCFGRLV